MTALQFFIVELGITIGDPEVWRSIGIALLLGIGCLTAGVWVTRAVGLLRAEAQPGEVLGVGLSAGLVLLAAWWAALGSGGRSSFTPVAIGFAVAIALASVQHLRRAGRGSIRVGGPRRGVVLMAMAGGLFVVAIALVYGATLAPSVRAGLQPVEFNDVAYYAVLGRDLATTGLETTLSATGFESIPGLPSQAWYHWGELWLAAAVIDVTGVPAMAARHFVVLPLVLLAAAALSGTVVRRWTRSRSSSVFVLGFASCLFLAPSALLPGPFFSSWATAMLVGITLYGSGAVALLFALYCVPAVRGREITWAVALFVGSAVSIILPAHLAVALLSIVGIGSVLVVRVASWVRRSCPPIVVSTDALRITAAAGTLSAATVAWGVWTGHTFGGGAGQSLVTPFNETWWASVALTALGAGALWAIAIALPLTWRSDRLQAELYVGALAILVAGAIGWGARLGDFTMFYLFFAGIAVIATPVATIAVHTVWMRLSSSSHSRLAMALVVLLVIQLGAGASNALLRLQQFSAQGHQVPVAILDAVRQLPPDAKIAYACQPLDETGFGVPKLLTIDVHTGHRVVPMCFHAEVLSTLVGAPVSAEVPNLYFAQAPQRMLYPDARAAPSSDTVAAFLVAHGIRYIYIDERHPNPLVDHAVPVATSGDAQLLRIP